MRKNGRNSRNCLGGKNCTCRPGNGPQGRTEMTRPIGDARRLATSTQGRLRAGGCSCSVGNVAAGDACGVVVAIESLGGSIRE